MLDSVYCMNSTDVNCGIIIAVILMLFMYHGVKW